MIFLVILVSPGSSSVLLSYERNLRAGFSESLLSNYMYYVRQYQAYDRAIKFLSSLEKKYPSNSFLYLAQGELYYRKNEPKKGFSLFKKAYKINKNSAFFIVRFYVSEEIEDIIDFVGTLRKEKANKTLYSYELTRFFLKTKDYERAFKEIVNYMKITKDVGPYQGALREIAENIGIERVVKEIKRIDAFGIEDVLFMLYLSAKDYKKAFEVAKKDKRLLNMLLKEVEKEKQFEVAIEVAEEIKDSLKIAEILFKKGEKEKAKEILKRNRSLEAKILLAEIEKEESKDYKKVIKIYKELEKMGYKEAYKKETELYLLNYDIKRAKKTSRMIPSNKERLFLESLIFFLEGEKDSLRRNVSLFIQRYPTDSVSNDLVYYLSLLEEYPPGIEDFKKGIVHYLFGNPSSALLLFKKLMDKDDIKDDAYFYMGRAFEKLKRYEEAVEAYLSLFKEKKESPFAPYSLYRAGWILKEVLKDREKSTRTFLELIKNYPSSPEANIARENI